MNRFSKRVSTYALNGSVSQDISQDVLTPDKYSSTKNIVYKKQGELKAHDNISGKIFIQGNLRNSDGSAKYSFQKHKNKLLVASKDKLLESDFSEREFKNAGSFRNLDTEFFVIAQKEYDIKLPAIVKVGNFIEIAYVFEDRIYFKKFDTQEDNFQDAESPADSASNINNLQLINLSSAQANILSETFYIYTAGSILYVNKKGNLQNQRIFQSFTKEIDTIKVVGSVIHIQFLDDSKAQWTFTPSGVVGTLASSGVSTLDIKLEDVPYENDNTRQTLFKFRNWMKFSYKGTNYRVVWSDYIGQYIIEDSSQDIALKINAGKVPFDDPAPVTTNSDSVDIGDSTYIPLFFSGQIEFQDGNIERPLGVGLLKIKDNFTTVNSGLINNTQLITGSSIRNFDGENLVEFGFNKRAEMKIKSVQKKANVDASNVPATVANDKVVDITMTKSTSSYNQVPFTINAKESSTHIGWDMSHPFGILNIPLGSITGSRDLNTSGDSITSVLYNKAGKTLEVMLNDASTIGGAFRIGQKVFKIDEIDGRVLKHYISDSPLVVNRSYEFQMLPTDKGATAQINTTLDTATGLALKSFEYSEVSSVTANTTPSSSTSKSTILTLSNNSGSSSTLNRWANTTSSSSTVWNTTSFGQLTLVGRVGDVITYREGTRQAVISASASSAGVTYTAGRNILTIPDGNTHLSFRNSTYPQYSGAVRIDHNGLVYSTESYRRVSGSEYYSRQAFRGLTYSNPVLDYGYEGRINGISINATAFRRDFIASSFDIQFRTTALGATTNIRNLYGFQSKLIDPNNNYNSVNGFNDALLRVPTYLAVSDTTSNLRSGAKVLIYRLDQAVRTDGFFYGYDYNGALGIVPSYASLGFRLDDVTSPKMMLIGGYTATQAGSANIVLTGYSNPSALVGQTVRIRIGTQTFNITVTNSHISGTTVTIPLSSSLSTSFQNLSVSSGNKFSIEVRSTSTSNTVNSLISFQKGDALRVVSNSINFSNYLGRELEFGNSGGVYTFRLNSSDLRGNNEIYKVLPNGTLNSALFANNTRTGSATVKVITTNTTYTTSYSTEPLMSYVTMNLSKSGVPLLKEEVRDYVVARIDANNEETKDLLFENFKNLSTNNYAYFSKFEAQEFIDFPYIEQDTPTFQIIYPVTSGGNVTIGINPNKIYGYRMLYKWIDGLGVEHRSVPSLPVIAKSSEDIGENNAVTLTLGNLNLTNKENVAIEIYRTPFDTTNYRLVNTITNNKMQDETEYVDVKPDAELGASVEPFLQNQQPDGCKFIELFGDRFVLSGFTNEPNKLIFSNPISLFGNFSPQFPESNFVIFEKPIRAIKKMDEKMFIFTNDDIFAWVVGQTPQSVAGSKNNTIVEGHEPAEGSGGLFFKTSKGIHLLTRQISLQYIGSPVQDFNNSKVLTSLELNKDNEIRFILEKNGMLVYNTFYRKWSHIQGGFVDGVVFNDNLYFLTEEGNLFLEAPIEVRSLIDCEFSTGWLSFDDRISFTKLKSFRLSGKFKDLNSLRATIYYNFNETEGFETMTYTVNNNENPRYIRFMPARQKCNSFKILFSARARDVEFTTLSFEYLVSDQLGIVSPIHQAGGS